MRTIQRISSLLLTLALAGLLVWVTNKYSFDADWTAGNRNSLTPASEQVLDAMPGEIKITAFAYPGPARSVITVQTDRYLRYRPDIEFEFIDPGKNPQKVRELNIGSKDVLQISYQGRTQTLNGELSEQSLTNTLQQLSVSAEQWLVFLQGHRERDPQEDSDAGYSLIRKELERQGFKIRGINLGESPRVPDNAAVLVIASPQNSLLSGEVQIIKDFVANGGNILWLDDPGPRLGLSPLATELGLAWDTGTVIYPDFRELGTGHPAAALVVNYPKHAITERMSGLTLFPFAGGLQAITDDTGWQATPILKTPPRSWLETGSLDNNEVVFSEDDGDRVGPIDIGFALERGAPERGAPEVSNSPADSGQNAENSDNAPTEQQRAIVVADSDFLSNAQINALGNMQLGVSLFQWLSNRDAQISVQVPAAPDASLKLAPWQGRFIWWGYVLFLPLALLIIGIGRWSLRRRR